MSEDLEAIYNAFLNSQVPDQWAKAAYPSLKPLGPWINDLWVRCEFTRDWILHGPPKSFWISGFFFPQGFLTGVLQNHARKYDLPIDELAFNFKVVNVFRDQADVISSLAELKFGETLPQDALLPALEDGALIHGIFMEAMRWDTEVSKIAEASSGEMNPRLPVVHMLPERNFTPSVDDYTSPLYKEGSRAGTLSTTGHSTNFVVGITIPCLRDPDYWIAMGAALLCQLPD